jgi:hypothetical protein
MFGRPSIPGASCFAKMFRGNASCIPGPAFREMMMEHRNRTEKIPNTAVRGRVEQISSPKKRIVQIVEALNDFGIGFDQ